MIWLWDPSMLMCPSLTISSTKVKVLYLFLAFSFYLICIFFVLPVPMTLQLHSSSSTTDSVTVNWNPIPCEDRGEGITSYRSFLFSDGARQRKTATRESVSFGNLKPCSSYTVQTQAFSGARRSNVLRTQLTTRTAGRTLIPIITYTLQLFRLGRFVWLQWHSR